MTLQEKFNLMVADGNFKDKKLNSSLTAILAYEEAAKYKGIWKGLIYLLVWITKLLPTDQKTEVANLISSKYKIKSKPSTAIKLVPKDVSPKVDTTTTSGACLDCDEDGKSFSSDDISTDVKDFAESLVEGETPDNVPDKAPEVKTEVKSSKKIDVKKEGDLTDSNEDLIGDIIEEDEELEKDEIPQGEGEEKSNLESSAESLVEGENTEEQSDVDSKDLSGCKTFKDVLKILSEEELDNYIQKKSIKTEATSANGKAKAILKYTNGLKEQK